MGGRPNVPPWEISSLDLELLHSRMHDAIEEHYMPKEATLSSIGKHTK